MTHTSLPRDGAELAFLRWLFSVALTETRGSLSQAVSDDTESEMQIVDSKGHFH
jgi:hypothetical protein